MFQSICNICCGVHSGSPHVPAAYCTDSEDLDRDTDVQDDIPVWIRVEEDNADSEVNLLNKVLMRALHALLKEFHPYLAASQEELGLVTQANYAHILRCCYCYQL